MSNIVANIIWFLHLIFIILVVIVPFSNSPYLLMMHSIFIPFMILHWVTNNDTCVLTTIEKVARDIKKKEDENDCLTCKLINPVFNFKKDNEKSSKFIYIITITLWLFSITKLGLKYKRNEITKLKDLFEVKPLI
jgi:hypothetical protein